MQLNVSNSNKRVQFPAPVGSYKVWVKDRGVWRNHKTVRLHVSMDNPKHSGDKFFALCEWASVRFDKAIVIVSDSLHRHNLEGGNAYKEALDKGNQWIAGNDDALRLLRNKSVIVWDYWRAQREFGRTLAELKNLYEGNDVVRYAFTTKAAAFAGCHAGASLDASLCYLLEEVAAFAIMFQQIEALDVYPGEWFKDIFDVLGTLDDRGTFAVFRQAHCMRVDFVKNKSPAVSKAA